MFKKISMFLLVLVSVLALSACGKTSDRLVVCVGPNPDTIDPALNSAVDGATMIIHAFTGLVGYQQDASGVLRLVPELATELPTPTTLAGGKVQYVFTLKEGLKWSDGTALDAHDFEYAWKRAASVELGADYSYMFDVIDGWADIWADEPSAEAELNVTASTDGTQLTVVLNTTCPYFFELCAFPTYMPVKQEIVDANPDTWATDVTTYVGNGPFKITEWTANSKIVMAKNEFYHNADAVVLDEIEFALSDDDTAILTNYQTGTYSLIDSVPNDEIAALKVSHADQLVIAGQLGTYYINFNVDAAATAAFSITDTDFYTLNGVEVSEANKVKIRKALSLFLDRNYIAEEIGQAGQQPANSYVPIGLTEPDGLTPFVEKNGPEGDGAGYYSVDPDDYSGNCSQAVALLQEVGYTYNEVTGEFSDFPAFTYLANEGSGHLQIAQYMQSAYAQYGITMAIEQQEWGTFLNTRKDGNFVLARNGWLGDYNDPISFLDMWTSTSGNNDSQFGKGAHASVAIYGENEDQTWAQTYDVLINEIKTESDQTIRFAKMHEAEDMIMATGAIVPLYYYTDLYMVSPDLEGFFASPLGYKFFMYASLK